MRDSGKGQLSTGLLYGAAMGMQQAGREMQLILPSSGCTGVPFALSVEMISMYNLYWKIWYWYERNIVQRSEVWRGGIKL